MAVWRRTRSIVFSGLEGTAAYGVTVRHFDGDESAPVGHYKSAECFRCHSSAVGDASSSGLRKRSVTRVAMLIRTAISRRCEATDRPIAPVPQRLAAVAVPFT